MSIGSLFNIGNSALNASSACISTTGNNIANANTEGYNRQYVRLEDAYTIDKRPGAQGQGVNATEIMRRFNKYIEKAYLDKSSVASRWNNQQDLMNGVQSLFNESDRSGISSGLSSFFNAWQDLTLHPADSATRQSLLSNSDNLALLLRQTTESIKQQQNEIDTAIKDQVTEANQLVKSIADLNKQINAHNIPGVSNPNMLLDERDKLVRQLSEIMDVTVQDRGAGNYTVYTKSGYPLVDGTQSYSLEVQGAQSEFQPKSGSAYQGNIKFEGSDSHEYTVEMVTGGSMNDPVPPSFRVSLDGGRTWLRDDDGQEMHFDVTDANGDGTMDPIKVKDLNITFTDDQNFNAGDKFTVTPKMGLYWVEPTRGPMNITPQIYQDGTDNANRLTGGALAAYFNVRDDNCGRYLDELNAVANSLIWETNRLHSQGAGLEKLQFAQGTYSVYGNNIPLGSPQSGLPFADKLTSGSLVFNIYNKETDEFIDGKPLDFTGLGNPAVAGASTFDPSRHSLQDVAAAINQTYPGQLKASISDGKLVVETDPAANPPLTFAMGNDTTGLMAGLGINTFFTGSDASDIAVSSDLHSNLNHINAGAVNGQHQANSGDMSTAEAIANLAKKTVSISSAWKSTSNQTLSEYFNALVGTVGGDTRTAQTNAKYNIALASDLNEQQASIGGVNIDEEMANLIKFQHSYTAAAKLITTADQMLQTLLGLKQ